jgi:chromate transporter
VAFAALWRVLAANATFHAALEGLRVAAWFLLVEGAFALTRGQIQIRWMQIFPFVVGLGVACFFPRWEPVVVLVFGVAALLQRRSSLLSISPWVLWSLFWVHAKAALTVFGTGLAVIPVLQSESIERQWLTLPQFFDGLTISQVTPGPITILSTYIGLEVAGPWGAVASTLGMYLPGLLVIGWGLPWLLRRIGEKPLEKFYGGAIPVVLGSLWGSALKLFFCSTWSDASLILLFVAAIAQVLLRMPTVVFFLATAGAAAAMNFLVH